MDPIDMIASRYTQYCSCVLQIYSEIEFVFRSSETCNEALVELERMKYLGYLDPVHPENLSQFADRYQLALESLEDIICLAKKVFIFNYYESDRDRIFNKEVSFSFACKMMSQFGPLICHFSNHPTHKQIIQAELNLACKTPYLEFNAETDLYCLESMVEPELMSDCESPPDLKSLDLHCTELDVFHQLVPSPQCACL